MVINIIHRIFLLMVIMDKSSNWLKKVSEYMDFRDKSTRWTHPLHTKRCVDTVPLSISHNSFQYRFSFQSSANTEGNRIQLK